MTLFRHPPPRCLFTRFFASHAPHCKRQGPQPPFSNLIPTLKTIAVSTRLKPLECFIDLAQRLGFHLNEGKLNLVLDVGFGTLRRVKNALHRNTATLSPHVTHPVVHLGQHVPAAFFEDKFQFGVALTSHRICCCHCHRTLSPSHYPPIATARRLRETPAFPDASRLPTPQSCASVTHKSHQPASLPVVPAGNKGRGHTPGVQHLLSGPYNPQSS